MIDESMVVSIESINSDIKDHLRTLFNLVVEMKAQVVVEVGAGLSTYALLAGVNKTGGHFWSIDQLATCQKDRFPQWADLLEKEDNYSFICGDDMEIIKLWERPIDLFFLDSSHEYQHTLDELEKWGRWVRVGGKIVMHDTYHTIGHAVRCREAMLEFLRNNRELFSAEHFENCGGLSILTKLK